MAFESRWIDRYKATGFYRHVEWNRGWGVMVKLYHPVGGQQAVSFEAVTMDHEYDQKLADCRQFFLYRESTVRFMLNLGLPTEEIIGAFRKIDGCQTVYYYVESNDHVRPQDRSLLKRG